MTNNEFRLLLNKYAILLFIGYALIFIISTVIYRFLPDTNGNDVLLNSLFSLLPTMIQLIINIIAAIMVSKDMQTLNIKNNLIVIFTIFFSLIGITMFFIMTYKEMKNAST